MDTDRSARVRGRGGPLDRRDLRGAGRAGEGEDGAPAGVVLLLLALAVSQGVAMRWRRTHPIPVTAVALVTGLAVLAISPDSVMPVAGYFAVGALASVCPPRVSLFGLAGVTAVASLNFFTVNAEDAAFAIVLGVGAWALGEAARNRRVVIHEEARRAVADEQARIARDIHDVVAHSVSVIVVQAAAADDVFEERPDQARAALRSIEQTGRDALRELRLVLGAMRPEADAPEHEPAAEPRPARRARRAAPRRRPRRRDAPRGRRGRRPGRRRPVRLPHRPGGAHQHAASRAGDPGRGRAEAGVRRARGRRPRQRPARRSPRARAATGSSGCASARRCSAARFEAGPLPEGGYRVHARLPLEATP